MTQLDQGHEPQIITVIAKLLTQFQIDFETFSKTLREQYVISVYHQCHSFSRTALKCGVDRRIVSSIIKGEKLYNKRPLLHTIIEAIQQQAQHSNGIVAKYGINSLNCIIDNHANGATTIKSVIDVLTQSGVIKDHGDTFTFVGYPTLSPQVDEQMQKLINQLSASTDDFQAAIHNIKKTTDNSQNTDLKH